jgi:hypothetical protein
MYGLNLLIDTIPVCGSVRWHLNNPYDYYSGIKHATVRHKKRIEKKQRE